MAEFDAQQRFMVTGASSGIGEAVAVALNARGASVVAIARNAERLGAMKAKCAHPENVFLETKDLSEDIDGLPAYVKSLKDKYGKFQGLAYCAGALEVKPLQMLSYSEMSKLFDINYFAPVSMVKGFADRRVNCGRGSACVVISSIASFVSARAMATYSGTKAALAASMKSAAREMSAAGVRLNVLSPTDIDTPMAKADPPASLREAGYPFGLGKPEDVANFAVFLLSDEAKWLTAQNYIVDCGSC